ncbi:MAG: SGNH/GDSL hydrolase family protein [Bacteroidales bacterium]|nr:SGNH/GDSL hydrolase family protein [Bacteroidales bacterium]
MLRKLIISVCAVLSVMTASAQNVRYVDASTLTVIGKPLPTTKAFTRIDTSVYKFNDGTIDRYASYSTGLAVLFSTDSRTIRARWITGEDNSGSNMAAIGQKGLDLYIMKDAKWVFAGVGTPDMDTPPYDSHESTIVADMAEGQKQCLLYLPLFDKVENLQIGIDSDAQITSLDNPFRHKIVVKGSSITHGASASRPGMSYPARLGRNNGWNCINLGFSGKSRLEKEYARYLADIKDVDAFIFDTFSNPSSDVIHERFDDFVDIIRAAHPHVPLIFLQTERRETRNFSNAREEFEAAKQKAAEEKVLARMKKDKHIYFIFSEDFLGQDHIATADGTHPTDLGFTRMLNAISPKLKHILKKYGIR